jgi:hypothetical protein
MYVARQKQDSGDPTQHVSFLARSAHTDGFWGAGAPSAGNHGIVSGYNRGGSRLR